MNRLTLSVSLLVLMLLPPPQSWGADVSPLPEPLPSTLGDRVDSLITTLMEEEGLHGVALGLVHDHDSRWNRVYGVASSVTRADFTIATPAALHELAQLFTAVAVMQLVERDSVELDAPLNRYVPDFSPHAEHIGEAEITVRQLLTHHSGLPAYYAPGAGMEDHYPLAEGVADYRQLPAHDDRMAFVTGPGSVYEYSYLGYSLLGLLIESVSGETFEAYVQSHILQPLQLTETDFVVEPDTVEGIASAHVDRDEVPHTTFRDVPAAGLVSSIRDMSRFMQALLQPGEILSRESTEALFTAQNRDVILDGNFEIGLGFFITPATGGTFRNEQTASHASTDGVARSYLLMLPEHGMGVVMHTNTELNTIQLRDTVDRIMEAMLEHSDAEFQPQAYTPHDEVPFSQSRAQEIIGSYSGPIGFYHVETNGDKLKLDVPVPFIGIDLLPRAEGFYGINIRLLGMIGLSSFDWVDLLNSSLEGKLVEHEGRRLIQWYWRGVAAVTLSEIEPPDPTPTESWQERTGRYESELTGAEYRLEVNDDTGHFTFERQRGGFTLFRRPPALYCARSADHLHTCSTGLVGTGTRNVLRPLPNGDLLSAYGEQYSPL